MAKTGFQAIQFPGQVRRDAAVVGAHHVKAGNGTDRRLIPSKHASTVQPVAVLVVVTVATHRGGKGKPTDQDAFSNVAPDAVLLARQRGNLVHENGSLRKSQHDRGWDLVLPATLRFAQCVAVRSQFLFKILQRAVHPRKGSGHRGSQVAIVSGLIGVVVEKPSVGVLPRRHHGGRRVLGNIVLGTTLRCQCPGRQPMGAL
mmetsp:Transcript_28716/g.77770  ORF Transcript_28716/g.77770 Transcript_28716/m.77770 type:complete len:201 (-) Transcript_28716:1107-1709(-)